MAKKPTAKKKKTIALRVPSGTESSTDAPGSVLTAWHPLLASLLKWDLDDGYQIEPEVTLSTQPQRLDVLLIKRQSGKLSARARRALPALCSLLNRYTLIEFKGPTDDLRW